MTRTRSKRTRRLDEVHPKNTDEEYSTFTSANPNGFQIAADTGPYLPEPQTLWSTGTIRQFRCRFTHSLFEALAAASGHHAEPELFDHIFLYANREVLLEWPDAFSNSMWIAPSVAEPRIKEFAAKLGVKYKYASHG